MKKAVLHSSVRDAVDYVDVHEGEPGALPAGRIAVIRADGSRAGHVSHKAGASVAERLLGRAGVKLTTHQGRPAWRAIPRGPAPVRHAPAPSVTDQIANLNAAKGSVTTRPTRPETTARPKR